MPAKLRGSRCKGVATIRVTKGPRNSRIAVEFERPLRLAIGLDVLPVSQLVQEPIQSATWTYVVLLRRVVPVIQEPQRSARNTRWDRLGRAALLLRAECFDPSKIRHRSRIGWRDAGNRFV